MFVVFLIAVAVLLLGKAGFFLLGKRCEKAFRVPCPVCGFKTLTRNEKFPDLHQWDVCPVCFWEDDSDFEGGGANEVSLEAAKENFAKYGAMQKRFVSSVRKPRPYEIA